jgi:hypothetical protein
MAESEFSVGTLGGDLEDKMLDLSMLCKTFDALAGDNPPDWLGVIWPRVVALDDAVQAYVLKVNRSRSETLQGPQASE